MIARISALSGVSPTEIRNWKASDLGMLERIDIETGLPDRQLMVLLSGLLSGLGGSDPTPMLRAFYPGDFTDG